MINAQGPLACTGSEAVRYYSLARHALLEGLRLAGVGKGDKVLLPAYICRDLLAPLAMLDATPVWYNVTPDMKPLAAPDSWPEAKVVLAINYFGFPQDLAPFEFYAANTGAVVIEDNAHGFLSRSEDGRWLGCRAGLGLFSIRKTLRIPDGAALKIREEKYLSRLPNQLPFDQPGLNPAQTKKAFLRSTPLLGEVLFRATTRLARLLRKWRTGSITPPSDPTAEREIPAAANPWDGLSRALAGYPLEHEISRRRSLYEAASAAGAKAGVTPVFSMLPEYCAPYGFPFRGSEASVAIMKRFAGNMGLDLVTWPDLPYGLESRAPDYYHNVYLINFLW